jgi:hypothetical protein
MHINWHDVISTLVAFAVGGATTWYVSKHYYVKAAKDLYKQAAIFGNFLQQWKDGKNVSLVFKKPGAPPSGQSITVHILEPIEGTLSLGLPIKTDCT